MNEENMIYKRMYQCLASVARNLLAAYDGEDSGNLAIAITQLEAQLNATTRPIEVAQNDDLRIHPGEWLTMRTTDELLEIRKLWYKRATDEGIISNCYLIGRQLGHRGGDSHKYEWESDGVFIYVDDMGQYMDVKFNGKRVCSTHQTSKLFVPGEWVNVIDRVIPAAKERQARMEIESNEEARKRLLDDLR